MSHICNKSKVLRYIGCFITQKKQSTSVKNSVTHLHCDNTIINDNFLCQEISANCGLVLIREALVHILVHERSLSYAGIAQNDDLQQNLLSRRHYNFCNNKKNSRGLDDDDGASRSTLIRFNCSHHHAQFHAHKQKTKITFDFYILISFLENFKWIMSNRKLAPKSYDDDGKNYWDLWICETFEFINAS